MFETKHIVLLLCSIALIVGILFLTKKWSLQKKARAFLYVGLASEVVKIFFYIIQNEGEYGGVLPKTDLPFHLCSIQIIFILVVNFSKSQKIKDVLLAFMLPSGLIGGAAAILIPTSSALTYWVITCQYFLYHVALICFALSILLDKEKKLTVKDYRACLIFIFALMFFAIYINSITYDVYYLADGTKKEIIPNFMYVVKPPQEGLPFLTNEHGWFVYIIHYAMLIFFAITACYIKPIYKALKGKFSKTIDKEINS